MGEQKKDYSEILDEALVASSTLVATLPASGEVGKRLEELSAWLSEHNIDMQMPDGMIDPAVAATLIEQLTAEKSASEEREGRMRAALERAKVIVTERAWYSTSTEKQAALAGIDAALTPEGQKVET